jgi:hypothetical protein
MRPVTFCGGPMDGLVDAVDYGERLTHGETHLISISL